MADFPLVWRAALFKPCDVGIDEHENARKLQRYLYARKDSTLRIK